MKVHATKHRGNPPVGIVVRLHAVPPAQVAQLIQGKRRIQAREAAIGSQIHPLTDLSVYL